MTTPPARRIVLVTLTTLFALQTSIAFAEEPAAAPQRIDFVKHIQPILRAKCYECHGAEAQEAGLRLDYRAAGLGGGDNGTAIVPGKLSKSLLFLAVAGDDEDTKMPPEDEGEPLTKEEVGLVRAWIEQGANWPVGVDGDASGKRLGADHWAFQPLAHIAPPKLNDPWLRNEIDAFVLRRLQREGVQPSPQAEPHVLIRRLYLDLIGLPPTPQELNQWLQQAKQAANAISKKDAPAAQGPAAQWYEQLVDHLLKSPHFGERWGRHWLDLARYADSDGYEKDLPRPYAWKWRDWVINAVNRDLPFDQFTIEQLAGDLLPGATTEQRTATGFHRNTLTNREGGVDQEEYRIKAVKDRVYTTSTVWLGLTAQCAECHSHKFDPISQQEYYELAAFFNNADEIDIATPTPGETAAYQQAKAKFAVQQKEMQAKIAAAEKSLAERQTAWETRLAAAATAARKDLPENILAALNIPADQRSTDQASALLAFYAKVDTELLALKKAADEFGKKAPKPPAAKSPVFAEHSQPRENYVHQRGDFRRPGQTVQAGVLGVLNPFQPQHKQPNRLDLARWLVDPANPLTPRVAVNRIWQYLFGRGIVETTWDFGTQGAPPTHPELLDWLAGEYLRRGWSRKAMIKLIVSSAAYRQSSVARPELETRDPKNDAIARQNRFRLDAEIVRDQYLTASGLLYRKVGGPGIYPALPADVAALGYAGSVKWRPSKAPDKYRRGMYIFFLRSVPYPMLTTFDAPESSVVSTQRDRSNTPLQSLTLLNDPVFVECSQALARRILDEAPADANARIDYVFRLCLARAPDEFERARLTQLHDQLLKLYEAHADSAAKMAGHTEQAAKENQPEAVAQAVWTTLARAIMNLDEFVTRE